MIKGQSLFNPMMGSFLRRVQESSTYSFQELDLLAGLPYILEFQMYSLMPVKEWTSCKVGAAARVQHIPSSMSF